MHIIHRSKWSSCLFIYLFLGVGWPDKTYPECWLQPLLGNTEPLPSQCGLSFGKACLTTVFVQQGDRERCGENWRGGETEGAAGGEACVRLADGGAERVELIRRGIDLSAGRPGSRARGETQLFTFRPERRSGRIDGSEARRGFLQIRTAVVASALRPLCCSVVLDTDTPATPLIPALITAAHFTS